jgi:hypothetical protein
MFVGRSRQPSGLRHELFSLPRKPESWARMPHKAWMFGMCICLFCVCVVLGRGLATVEPVKNKFIVLVINVNFEYATERLNSCFILWWFGFEARLGDPIIMTEDCRNFTLLLQTTNAVVIISRQILRHIMSFSIHNSQNPSFNTYTQFS